MKNVFLAPRSNELSYENFESTIIGGRPISFFKSFLTDRENEQIANREKISVWGCKKSLRNRWERMEKGDFVLFYAKGLFYFRASVVMKTYNEELGSKLWPLDENGESWPCLFFVENVEEVNIPIKVIQELGDYDPSWDRVQGFMRLNQQGVKAISTKFGSLENFFNQKPETYTVIENMLAQSKDEILEEEKTDSTNKKQVLAEASKYKDLGQGYGIDSNPKRHRIESKAQKKRIALIEDYACQICNWSMEWVNKNGKKLYRIDIDHIVDKAKGGGEELANLWALCPNCHAKKTFGVIKIDLIKKVITENDVEIKLHHDNHLNWH